MLASVTGSQTAPVSGTYQYDPYGTPIGSGASTFAYLSGHVLPGGVTHFGARYYDSAIAQWTQPDSLGEGYIYSTDDPIDNNDPSGQGGALCFEIGALTINCNGAGFILGTDSHRRNS